MPTSAQQVVREPQVTALPASPTAPPPSTASPTSTPTRRPSTVHAVQPGETLIAIALQYDLSLEELLAANDLLDPDLLRIGQKIIIPKEGEAGAELADATAEPIATPTVRLSVSVGPGMRFACSANSRVHPIVLPAEPIQLLTANDMLYLVADGRLYGLPIEQVLRQPTLLPVELTPADGRIGDIIIEELVYATVDPQSGDLLLLDKSNDIYRYMAEGEWRVEILAAPIPGQFPDPQYLALAMLDDDLYVLDADLSHIWQFKPGATLPETYFVGGALADAMDMTFIQEGPQRGDLYVLTRAGRVVYIPAGAPGRTISQPDLPVTWPAQILSLDGRAVIVDGDTRTVAPPNWSQAGDSPALGLRFEQMQRLRSVVQAGDTLFAIAGPNLYLADLPALDVANDDECPPVALDDTLYFHGESIANLLTEFALPFPNAVLPNRPRSYPGARRLYRFGIHTGMDLYANDAGGLGFGSPVSAIADGTVLLVDHDYVPISAEEFDAALAQTEAEHRTNDELFELFMGRQVQLDHGRRVASYYGHLDSTAPALSEDGSVLQGATLGTVGVTGTSGGAYGYTDGSHLHYEIWIGDRYLGQGLSLYETMRLWQAIFE